MEFPKENILDKWLDENKNPEIDSFIEKNLAIVDKVRIALEAKNWSKGQLAEAMDKRPSEVSKWLSGTHNLTMKSIIKMEIALGIDLMHTEPIKEYEYVFLGTVENQGELKAKADEYSETCESQEYEIAM